MRTSGEKIIEYVSQQVGVEKVDLVRKSLFYFVEVQIKHIESELFELRGKYEINTPEDFENLYKEGKIEEEGTWRDYQKFENLTFKIKKLKKLRLELEKSEEL